MCMVFVVLLLLMLVIRRMGRLNLKERLPRIAADIAPAVSELATTSGFEGLDKLNEVKFPNEEDNNQVIGELERSTATKRSYRTQPLVQQDAAPFNASNSRLYFGSSRGDNTSLILRLREERFTDLWFLGAGTNVDKEFELAYFLKAQAIHLSHLYKTMPNTALSGNSFPECRNGSENGRRHLIKDQNGHSDLETGIRQLVLFTWKAGGLDSLTLNSLYDKGAYKAYQQPVYGSPAPNQFEAAGPFGMSAPAGQMTLFQANPSSVWEFA
ncbi:hypothetical protein Tco_0840703 [Tanacetum coccineum]|uniref:Uncharacterized protein n=1 Tax=Tanacetum coccineum TaxID=301880 RepID=A0ABQ5AYN4_9ASTR